MEKTMGVHHAKSQLNALTRTWPFGYWIFAADGKLHLMKSGPDGNRVYLPSGGVDPDYIVASYSIPSDGGDW